MFRGMRDKVLKSEWIFYLHFLFPQRMSKWYRTHIFELFSWQSRRLITRYQIAIEQVEAKLLQSNYYFYQKPSNSLDTLSLLNDSGLLLGECRGQFTPHSCSREWHMPWCRGLQVLPLFSFTKAVLPAVSAFSDPFLCSLSSQWVLMLQSQRYLLRGSSEQLTATWQKERWFMPYRVRKLIWVSEFSSHVVTTDWPQISGIISVWCSAEAMPFW